MKKLFTLAICAMIASFSFAQSVAKERKSGNATQSMLQANANNASKGMMKGSGTYDYEYGVSEIGLCEYYVEDGDWYYAFVTEDNVFRFDIVTNDPTPLSGTYTLADMDASYSFAFPNFTNTVGYTDVTFTVNADGTEIDIVLTLETGETVHLVYSALAQPVIDLIDAIGEVNLISSKKIVAAREAYDALSETAQACVTNYDVLLAAEALYHDMLEFNDYRTECAIGLSWVVGPFDRAEIGDIAAEAVLKLMELQYQPDLTLEQNKHNVYEIFDAYRKVLFQKRGDLAHATIFADAKEKAKLNIMLFLGISDSQSARDAAEAGKAAIDALEYDDETDIINNIEEIQDIVIDTKINIVKAWMADFEDFKDVIRNIIGISPQLESIKYDKELTYNENIAKLEAVREAAAGSATSIESISADSAKPMKYIENGKLVIVKNGSKYAANGAIIK